MSKRPSNGCAPSSRVEPAVAGPSPWRIAGVALLVISILAPVSGCRLLRQVFTPAENRAHAQDTAQADARFPGETRPQRSHPPPDPVTGQRPTQPHPEPTARSREPAPLSRKAGTFEEHPAPVDDSLQSTPNHLPTAFAAEPPKRLHRPVPVFPAWTDLDQVLGSHALFRVYIDETGSVTQAELIETTAEDNVGPAREALLESRYQPVLSPAGFPVRATIIERIEF